MHEHIQDFAVLTLNASQYMLSHLSYSQKTVVGYNWVWKQIRRYMVSTNMVIYDHHVEKMILHHKFGDRSLHELSHSEKHFYNGVRMLAEFQKTGKINLPVLPRKNPLIFSGPIGEIITKFLAYKRDTERLSNIRLNCYQRNLFNFLVYCNENNIVSMQSIDLRVILGYINTMEVGKTPPLYLIISTLRGFMRYAFVEKLMRVDYAQKMPRCKIVNQPKLPSTYSKDEIEKLILSVDRSSAIGKRNFAIILLAARLGLRASDISWLKFENLHWTTSTIKIKQHKTGKELILPLLAEVGNAIIDYLKYGRPASQEPYVFLTQRPPCRHFTSSNVVTHVVQRAFKKAGIASNERRFGPHALRHSLGFSMLQANTILPVISEVLGHESSESTKYYLRIDLNSMRQCMLEVPLVARDFYQQKGGGFYE